MPYSPIPFRSMRCMRPFSRLEAEEMFARLVSGWAEHLDPRGARSLTDGISLPDLIDQGGSLEGATRMLWGLGGWLSQPNRPDTLRWRNKTYSVSELMRTAVIHGCNPSSPSAWGPELLNPDGDQCTVESGHVLFTLWQARERVWKTLSEQEQAWVYAFEADHGQRPATWRNNWALFWLDNHASRRALGLPHDLALMDSVLDDFLPLAHAGDGWFDDGPRAGGQHFDDYNWWVFTSHQLLWVMMDGERRPEVRERVLGQVRQLMENYPYFFAANGAYSEYGRSLSYKFARLGAPLWAYRLGVWPYSAGMLKRLVGRHLRWYFDRGAVSEADTLIQPLTRQGTFELRDPYNATGSSYWAMQAFGALWSIPDDDPFWTAEEEPLPVETGDFVRVLPQPGWVLVGNQETGSVQRFVAGTSSSHAPHYNARYDKFVYSTLAPFNAGWVDGAPSPDAMLSLTDGYEWGHRGGNQAFAVGKPGWLRMQYTQTVGGGVQTIETIVVCLGQAHIRAHRVHLDPLTQRPLAAVEGAAALGYAPGMSYLSRVDPAACQVGALIQAGVDRGGLDRAVCIWGLKGYHEPELTSSWRGHTGLNSVYGAYVLPLLRVAKIGSATELLNLVHIGNDWAPSQALVEQIGEDHWAADGSWILKWKDGRELRVPPLSTDKVGTSNA